MKKSIISAIILALVLLLAACSENTPAKPAESGNQTVSQAESQTESAKTESSAAEEADDPDFQWRLNDDGSVWLDCYLGEAEEVIIPTEYRGTPVTGIDVWAFRDKTSVKRVVIPETVVVMEENIFMGCTNLEEVVMPPRVEVWGDQIFSKCEGLKRIVVPDGVTGLIYRDFDRCTGLEEIVIPASVTEVKEAAFEKCDAVKRVLFRGTADEWAAITFSSNMGLGKNTPYELVCGYDGE